MSICTDHESEVCYESRDCPACKIQKDLDEANEQIENLKSQVDELKTKD